MQSQIRHLPCLPLSKIRQLCPACFLSVFALHSSVGFCTTHCWVLYNWSRFYIGFIENLNIFLVDTLHYFNTCHNFLINLTFLVPYYDSCFISKFAPWIHLEHKAEFYKIKLFWILSVKHVCRNEVDKLCAPMLQLNSQLLISKSLHLSFKLLVLIIFCLFQMDLLIVEVVMAGAPRLHTLIPRNWGMFFRKSSKVKLSLLLAIFLG